MSASEIEDRRQRAREAYWDSCGVEGSALGAAIETATQVKITPELIDTFRRNMKPTASDEYVADKLAVFFTAAGFEVIE